MGRSCCVPGCKANYYGDGPCVSTFSFPKDADRRVKWVKSINRETFEITKNTVVCINHFAPQFIIRVDKIKTKDGTISEVPRKYPKLANDAFPTIFPNQPSYCSSEVPQKRIDPVQRVERIIAQDEANFKLWREKDCIKTFQDLKEGLKKRDINPFISISTDELITFVNINVPNFSDVPILESSFQINVELDVAIFNGKERIPTKKYRHCLSENLKCDKWSQFENLVTSVRSLCSAPIPLREEIDYYADVLKILSTNEDLDSVIAGKVHFLTEQLHLAVSSVIRYSSSMLIWAATFFYSYPGAYRKVRDSNQLTLPHPKYLSKILCSFGNNSPGLTASHISFLREKFKLLNDEDKIVNLQLDEIYVNSKLTYKAGKILGLAEEKRNTSDYTAGTIQAFLSSSLRSPNKDVIALFPVRNLDGCILQKLTLNVLKVMVEVGFTILCLLADNNQVNKKMYELMCNGTLKVSIQNPYDPSKSLFFLFDSVHLFKNIRNSWLNASDQVLKIPFSEELNPLVNSSRDDLQVINVKYVNAQFSDLKDLQRCESNFTLKLGHKLSRKAVYPSSIERQNVSLVVDIFRDSTIAALETLRKDNEATVSEGTIYFLKLIAHWWKICNVKQPCKGRRINDMWCEPLYSSDQMKMKFLEDFKTWLELWSLSDENGKLTAQTQFALTHTVKAVIALSSYIFEEYKWQYILLGKLQTDNLEARFGAYRRLSGSSYHVSVQQVLESERKLKLLSVLKLKSEKKGEFSITSFTESCKSACELDKDENIEALEDAIYDVDSIDVSLNNRRVLICLASYVGTKTLQAMSREHLKICESCKSFLISDSMLEVEQPEEMYDFFSGLDRGGLNKPGAFTFDLCTLIFKLFSVLISREYEEDFQKLRFHQQAVIQLGVKLCENVMEDTDFTCNNCDFSFKRAITGCLKRMSNVLLNNYHKNVDEANSVRQIAIKLEKQNKRKNSDESFGKEKNIDSRKILKLNSNRP